jgi:hypothetical protein
VNLSCKKNGSQKSMEMVTHLAHKPSLRTNRSCSAASRSWLQEMMPLWRDATAKIMLQEIELKPELRGAEIKASRDYVAGDLWT